MKAGQVLGWRASRPRWLMGWTPLLVVFLAALLAIDIGLVIAIRAVQRSFPC